jgi:iron complex transport system substrate-binding protein
VCQNDDGQNDGKEWIGDMPIELEFPVVRILQDEFHVIDEVFTGLVFQTHNELGRLCDEKVYQNELLSRAERAMEAARKEFRITVRYGRFAKTYRVDMLVNRSVVYELKCAEALAPAHQTQTLHYLLLLGLHHGKVFNFRPERVEYRYVSTHLTPERRYEFCMDVDRWQDREKDSKWLRTTVAALLNDWGAFLDFELFYEAIRFLRGGDEAVIRRIEMAKDGRSLGRQKAHLLNPVTAVKLSAVTKNSAAFESHLRKFLSLTSLECFQCINFNHHQIEFRTISRARR